MLFGNLLNFKASMKIFFFLAFFAVNLVSLSTSAQDSPEEILSNIRKLDQMTLERYFKEKNPCPQTPVQKQEPKPVRMKPASAPAPVAPIVNIIGATDFDHIRISNDRNGFQLVLDKNPCFEYHGGVPAPDTIKKPVGPPAFHNDILSEDIFWGNFAALMLAMLIAFVLWQVIKPSGLTATAPATPTSLTQPVTPTGSQKRQPIVPRPVSTAPPAQPVAQQTDEKRFRGNTRAGNMAAQGEPKKNEE